MKTERLLEELAQDLKPVKVIRLSRMLPVWVAGGALLSIVSVSLLANLSLQDLIRAVGNGSLMSVFVASLFLGMALMASSVTLGVPGRRLSLFSRLIIAGLVLFLLGTLGAGALSEGVTSGSLGCGKNVLLAAVPSMAFMLFQLRRMAAVKPLMAGAVAAAGCALITGAVFLIVCPDESSSHIVHSHFLIPMGVIILLSALITPRLLRW